MIVKNFLDKNENLDNAVSKNTQRKKEAD